MKSFIGRLFLILLYVICNIMHIDGGIFSHIVTRLFIPCGLYLAIRAICHGFDVDDDEFLFPWVAGILNVYLIFMLVISILE